MFHGYLLSLTYKNLILLTIKITNVPYAPRLRAFHKLQELNLDNNNITDITDITQLLQLSSLPKLQKVSIRNNPAICEVPKHNE